MPRVRPLRTKEEVAQVDPSKSVTIELQPEGEINLEAENNPLEQEGDGSRNTQKTKQKQEVKSNENPSPQEDDPSDLKRQLEEMRRAKEDTDRRIEAEIRARQEAERLAQEHEREASQTRVRAEDAEYDAILNAIGAAETEAEHAQRDIALATEASDPKSLGEATRRLARAESRLVQLQDGKDAIERAKTEAAARVKENPPQRQNQRQPTVEEYIDQLPNLTLAQRDWLKSHPDAMTDNRKNMRLQGAHVEAEDQGIRVGSQEYFNYLEERLGYRKAQKEENMDEEDNARAPVSAPPSRQATNPASGRPANANRITLTPEQREMARLSGIDEITYARQLQKLNQLKSEGHYSSN